MSQTPSPVMDPGLASVSYVPIVAQIRRLLVVALVSGITYALLLHASKAYCAGGVNADGGFTDAAGKAVAAVPMCVTLTLTPSPIVYLAIAFIVLLAVSKAINKSPDLDASLHSLGRAALVIGTLVLVSIVIAQLWFAFIPITEWSATGSYAFYYPFPFGSVDLATSPMPVP